jgi:hypothetical protein
MKLNKKLSLIALIMISGSVISVSSVYAWYLGFAGITTDTSDNRLSANSDYYYSGDGSKDNPYKITQARHLYNLAWLQDLGYYDDEDNPTYFELANDIDMSDLKKGGVQSPLPPIGILNSSDRTNSHPFVGNFKGNGYSIKNLMITTDFTSDNYLKPSKYVLDERTTTLINGSIASDYTGLFGYIGSKTRGTKLETSVSDFTLANAKIGSTKNTLSGYIAGYVDNDISEIGVYHSSFNFSRNVSAINGYKYISNYGLIGDYDSDNDIIEWQDKPSQNGVGYGSSTDLRQLYIDLSGKKDHSIGKNEAYPFRVESSTIIERTSDTIQMKLSQGTKLIETVKTQKASTKGNNLGYFVGSDIKLYDANKKGINYSKFYYPHDSGSSYELPYSNGNIKYNAPDEEIVNYLTSVQTAENGSTYKNGDYLLRMTGSAQIDIINEKGLYAVPNAQVGSWQGNLLVPNRVIWVAPIKPGTMKFVLYNPESKAMGFRLYKLIRSTPKNYSTYFKDSSNVIECNATLLPGKAYYFEQNISQADVDNGYEYALSAGDGYKPYIAYMDIGVNGDSTSTIANIANVDFVYTTGVDTYSKVTPTNLSGVGFILEGEVSTAEFILTITRTLANGIQYIYSGSGVNVTAYGKAAKDRSSQGTFLE